MSDVDLDLDSPLTGPLGARTAKALATALDLHTVGDLLRHYPRRYAERGDLTAIASLAEGDDVTVVAEVRSARRRQMRSRRGSLLEVVLSDGNDELDCTFFARGRGEELRAGVRGLFAGKVTSYRNRLQLSNPDYEPLVEDDDDAVDPAARTGLIPVYPATGKVRTWQIARSVQQVLKLLDDLPDPLPAALRARHRLPTFHEAITWVHAPADRPTSYRARDRLKWDEALAVQLALARRRQAALARPAPVCAPVRDGLLDRFDRRLPWALTEGQSGVGEAIAGDLVDAHPMNRLLQGEVGSGKTVVALRAMLQVLDAGRQAAMLAPTEVLAGQHARSLADLLGPLALGDELGSDERATRVALLTGSLPAKQRKQALLAAASGQAGIVVGTHALIQDAVSFADLGMVVVDEQHRFGVEQRDALRGAARDGASPHVLVMTATPIPRTVAMTVYGDLEVSSLRELPVGRSPIATTVVPAGEKPSWLQRVWQRITEEVAKGHQVYVVCPRIGDGSAADDTGIDGPGTDGPGTDGPGTGRSDRADGPAPDDPPGGAEPAEARRPAVAVLDLVPGLIEGPLKGLRVGVLHGRLPAEEKDTVMRGFAAGSIDVLVATTVVEVGVDVPNASTMVIMDADRFGLSQLHQLRGRVGRGSVPGLCLLVTDSAEDTPARERLDAVASTTDGFELARLDLETRREGDVLGASQSGRRSGLRLLSLLRDEKVIAAARDEARDLIAEDPELTAHPLLAALVAELVDAERAEYLEKV